MKNVGLTISSTNAITTIAYGGYTIRVVEELHTRDPVVFTDGVLYNLMQMGVMDWTGENVRMNQSTQAMRLATALASRLIRIANADCANVSV